MKVTIQREELKRVMNVVSLAVVSKSSMKDSHALFCPTSSDTLKVYATDEDRIATASCPISLLEGDAQKFTADPKKVLALISGSETDTIIFEYIPEDKTLRIHVSENEKSFVSMPCFDPEEMVPFDEELDKMLCVRTVNAGQLLSAIRFGKGFLPTKENPNFSCLYLSDGVMYGSNGFNRISAYQAGDWKGIETLVLRQGMLDSISQLIDRINLDDISIYTSSKFIGFFSEDKGTGFGFLKTVQEMPKFPISLDRPETGGVALDRTVLQKKLQRFQIAEGPDFSVNFVLKGTGDSAILEMTTLGDRASTENMPCIRKEGSEDQEFLVKYTHLKTLVSVYQSNSVELYVGNVTLTVFCEGKLEIDQEIVVEEEPENSEETSVEDQEPQQKTVKQTVEKPFKAVGVFSLAKEK